jgi:hypothetical protein
LLDGSAQEWVEAIRSAGLCAAEDISGQKLEKMVPKIDEPVYLWKDDCYVAAFPSSQIHITYGIDFPKVCLMPYFFVRSQCATPVCLALSFPLSAIIAICVPLNSAARHVIDMNFGLYLIEQ